MRWRPPSVALAVLWLAVAGGADAATTDRQTARLGLTTTEPGAPTGTSLAIEFRNPAEPAGKPHTVASIVVRLAPGSVIDTSVPEQCKASDLDLMLRGAAACPAGSRVGDGALVSDSGSPGVIPRYGENTLTTFNNEDELIGLAESSNPPTRFVSRSRISGSTITIEFPALPGNPPPDPYLAYKTFRSSSMPIVRAGRAYARTPPSCPAGGRWIGSLTFTYRDGVSQRVLTRPHCRPGGSSRSPCLARRAPIGPRRVGRVRLRAPRARLLALPVRPPRRRRSSLRWCVKRSPREGVTAVFGRDDRAELVVTTASGHGSRGVRPGASLRRLRRAFPASRRLSPGLYRAGPRSRRLIGVRGGRVRFWAVATGDLLRRPGTLRRALRG
jgi:hypothetical protein